LDGNEKRLVTQAAYEADARFSSAAKARVECAVAVIARDSKGGGCGDEGLSYERLNELLEGAGFDEFVEGLCARFYHARLGRPSLRPGIYFRALLVGYFEGIDGEPGIAWRVADSLALRRFLLIGLILRSLLATRKEFPGIKLEALKFLHLQRKILFQGHETLHTDTTHNLEREAWLLRNGYTQAEGVAAAEIAASRPWRNCLYFVTCDEACGNGKMIRGADQRRH
jgi:hypothetical protein